MTVSGVTFLDAEDPRLVEMFRAMVEESLLLDGLIARGDVTLDEAGRGLADDIRDIPRGNTCPGVNRLVLNVLAKHFGGRRFRLLDAPCGSGEFLDALTRFLPRADTHGCDLADSTRKLNHAFTRGDLQQADSIGVEGTFDAITCISGVMEFDNTLSFLQKLRRMMSADGLLVITNDNLLTVRDRLLYLLEGRFGQYSFSPEAGTPTWKVIPLDNLLRLLTDAGFELEKVEYTPPSTGSWCWLPIALAIHLLQRMIGTPLRVYFPFKGLLSRHYVLTCRPR